MSERDVAIIRRPSVAALRGLLSALLALAAAAAVALAQTPKPAPKDAPRVLMALPFGIAPGKPVQVEMRGLNLDTAKSVRLAGKGTIKLLKGEKLTVPNMREASKEGSSRVLVEVALAEDVAGEAVEAIVVTPAGEAPPHRILVVRKPLTPEKEPNDGFKTAQPVKAGETIEGRIVRDRDVDVYRFELKAGEEAVVEVFAARHGGALDSFLEVFDSEGNIIASSDDLPGTTDSRVRWTAKKAGVYYASVTDAHGQGGPGHLYWLTMTTPARR
jgi:hypothetical protein